VGKFKIEIGSRTKEGWEEACHTCLFFLGMEIPSYFE